MGEPNKYKHIIVICTVLGVIIPGIEFFYDHSSKQPSTPNPVTEVKITYPSNFSTVNMNDTLSGIAKNIPEGKELYILVYAPGVNKYYPQNNRMHITDDMWSVPIWVGLKSDVGEQFDIIAVIADKDAQVAYTSYMITCNKTNERPGLADILSGSKECDKITVIRK